METVEATQKAIYRGPPSQTMAIGPPQCQKEIEALSQQIRMLTTELENLKNPLEDHTSFTRSAVMPSRRGHRQCWRCGRYGHFQRECRSKQQNYLAANRSSRWSVQNVLTSPKVGAVMAKGFVRNIPTDMLVDTG